MAKAAKPTSKAPRPEPVRPAARSARQERANATRRRILRAAYDLVCELGYEATTMTAIAARAGVAVQTLYFTFNTKPAILREVLHAAVVSFERWAPTIDQDVATDHRSVARERMAWFGPFEDEPEPRRAIEIYVDGTAEIWSRVGPLLVSLGPQRGTELEGTLVRSERLRKEASFMLVTILAAKGSGLRPSLRTREAVDIFMVLTRAELYHDLTVGHGWSDAKTRRFLVELLAHQLLGET